MSREISCTRLFVEYARTENTQLSFYGAVRRDNCIPFDSAEDVLKFVEEVEELL